jgi:4-hydroxy-2-oxoheptanedioate aldolase
MIAAPQIPELLAAAGFDAVVLDCEHGALGPEALDWLVPVCRSAGLPPIVRVRAPEPALIGAALDVGAAGVLVPQIESAAQAREAVTAARFGAGGRRGTNPYVRAAGYHADAGYFARANGEHVVLLMIEGPGGIAALPEILALPGLDGVFIGPYDLSQSLGVPGQVEHPEVLRTVERLVRETASRGVATAVFAPTPALARRWLDLGVRLVGLGFDTAMILDGFRAVRSAAR